MRLSTQASPVRRHGQTHAGPEVAAVHAQENGDDWFDGGVSSQNTWCDLCNAIYFNYRLCYQPGTGYHWHDCGY